MRLDDEDPKNGLQLVPGTYGQNFPSTCTIVIIAGKNLDLGLLAFSFSKICHILFFDKGKYLNRVDRVMTQVDKITEDIAHMPVAAFIFRDQESDEVHFSADIR